MNKQIPSPNHQNANKQGINVSELRLQRDSVFLQPEIRGWWVHNVMRPFEYFCLHKNISPNLITLFATFLCFVCAWLYGSNHILIAGWLSLLVGSLDVLDGRVARATGKVTAEGAFLDSVMDRYQDFMLFAGLCILYRENWVLYLLLIALGGTTFVPYVRAKADSLGIDLSNIGSMQRPERFFLLGFGSIVSSVFQISLMPFFGKGNPPPQHLLIFVIGLLAITTNWTAIRRIQYTLTHLSQETPK